MPLTFKETVDLEASAVIAFIQKHPKTGAILSLVVGLVLGRLVLVHLL